MVGSLLFSNAVTLGSGGVYILNVTDASGLAGVGYSSVTVAGALTVTATPGSPFAVNLVSLNPDGSAGPATFSAASTYSWTLLSAGSIVGFAPADFSLNTSAFQNSTAGGVFSFSENGNAIDLNFTPVPEPSTWLLLTAGLGVLLFVGNRKRLIDRSLGKT